MNDPATDRDLPAFTFEDRPAYDAAQARRRELQLRCQQLEVQISRLMAKPATPEKRSPSMRTPHPDLPVVTFDDAGPTKRNEPRVGTQVLPDAARQILARLRRRDDAPTTSNRPAAHGCWKDAVVLVLGGLLSALAVRHAQITHALGLGWW